MNLRREAQFWGYLTLLAALWLPVATWLMPRIASAPTWEENPAWYVSSGVMAVVLAYLLRLVAAKLRGR